MAKWNQGRAGRWRLAGLAWLLIGLAVQASAQTNGVDSLAVLARDPATVAGNWHGYTVWHLLGLTVAGWVTHANGARLLPAYRWIQGEGGVGRILVALVWSPKVKHEA